MKKAKNSKQLSPKAAAEYRAKWGVPDWENPEAYEYVKSLEENELRWEFLRRDENYRLDWAIGETYGYMKYELREWCNPAVIGSPDFTQPCELVDFSECDKTKQHLHYASLAQSKLFGAFIFCVDGNSPLKPQLAYITAVHKKYAKSALSPTESRKRDKRKNNKNGRAPAFLLRALDADNEHVHINDLATALGGENGITIPAMQRTVDFAHSYWRRF